jgi:ribonuclease P/MRP protein subunit POP5
MKLSPSLRQKKRYIVFEVISDQKFTAVEVKKEVEQALLSFLGQFGVAQAAPLFLGEKFKNNKFIIKINHKYVNHCVSALILIKSIKNKSVILKSIITSGTIKNASVYL